jgi:hypothetical protein
MEICNIGDGDESTMVHSDDLWDTIMALTLKRSRRKSIDPPASDTPHCWDDFTKHAALANLLDGAVAHKDLQFRKTYIERIMGLPPATQRALMALIERRKKAFGSKTPSKKQRSAKKRAKASNNSPSSAILDKQAGKTDGTPMKNESAPPSEARSPFSPQIENLSETPYNVTRMKPVPGSGPASTRSRGRGLFATPNCMSKSGPRRSFEEAFGSTPPCPNSALPSPKRVPVAAGLFSPGMGDTAEYEKEVQGLRERNEELASELERSRQKEQDISQKLEDTESSFRMEMMKTEAAARRRQEETKEEYENRLAALESDLECVNEQTEVAARAKAELAGVKDEM